MLVRDHSHLPNARPYDVEQRLKALRFPVEAVFQDHIRELKAAGRTVLSSSHILAQVEVPASVHRSS